MRGFLKEWGKNLDLSTALVSTSVKVVLVWPWSLASLAKESAPSEEPLAPRVARPQVVDRRMLPLVFLWVVEGK
ncbi:hypothetical protein TNIN_16971 [Trichonephila inaurata madagascariensis]|uniref:Uncharacterized protein n=1 Tax=Trichonephila inaurata madagascariensis TaxID=2747483 RepID=A0A8X6WU46_9ARAC|nr:hypothetical protein TNIN_16971 [Trichonephila inaurata madagascariensis]